METWEIWKMTDRSTIGNTDTLSGARTTRHNMAIDQRYGSVNLNGATNCPQMFAENPDFRHQEAQQRFSRAQSDTG